MAAHTLCKHLDDACAKKVDLANSLEQRHTVLSRSGAIFRLRRQTFSSAVQPESWCIWIEVFVKCIHYFSFSEIEKKKDIFSVSVIL